MMMLTVAAALAGAETPSVDLASPWAAIAKGDIDEILRLLRDNHPGPVDPENRTYAERFERNYPKALTLAASAKSFFDYKRAVLAYTNGFRDGHTVVLFTVDATAYHWPGFSASLADDGRYRVTDAGPGAPVAAGDEIVACDSLPIESLMRERIDPFHWNADIPHERKLHVGKLFAVDSTDEPSKFKSCTVRTSASVREVPVTWRSLPRERADKLRAKHVYEGEPTLTQSAGLWVVKLPSFMFDTPSSEAQIKQLLSELKAHSREIRTGKIVLDVRGNAGGSSAWAAQIASAIWGQAIVDHVANSFDWTVDWRASPANLRRLNETLANYERNKLVAEANGVRRTRDLVAAALREGSALARVPYPPANGGATPPASEFTGKAYLMTDEVCASACLDFVDIVRRLPNVKHVGWPTSADAVYIDNSLAPLPSRLGLFAYSMKVYRKRIRANNQWYDPQVPWPGGPVTDAKVVSWIAGLN